MKWIVALFAFAQLSMLSSPLAAQDIQHSYGSVRTVATESWVEEWDPVTQSWVKVADGHIATVEDRQSVPTLVTTYVDGAIVSESRNAARYAFPFSPNPTQQALAQYGPFKVISTTRAALIGSTDSNSPYHFDAMLRDYPALSLLEMIEAPGTSNDIANLAVGRKIRAAGMATHVPAGGSVRSGAVELFLAGATRTLEDGAQFAVHSWLDNYGREADDFAADHTAHNLYLDYYQEMGMSEQRARQFYAMTNSVPHASARWLRADEMRQWIAPERSFAKRLITAQSNAFPRIGTLVKEEVARTQLNALSMRWETPPASASAMRIGEKDFNRPSIAWLDLSLLDSGEAFP